ncbi:AAA-domain-containing protein [Venturia nashicola]|uniref:AAA-domain-containing protein n=1 Tax=Venturia nashicola TaxID=86259 RepID=A0A4Z1NZ58_9PEZI|nr:AAA-domain-containing protein [Venturia nashicola]
MMRAKPANAMQKTYDDCYLVCSTAVYFESQNNEDEALRSWKNALDQIYYHNAYRMPSNYSPKSETEKALFDSLRSMELQCKERVDLLGALKSSREEANMASKTSSRESLPPPPPHTSKGVSQDQGGAWLGEGTVPPMDYAYLTRPPLPIRPGVPTRRKSGGSDGPTRKNTMPKSEPSLPTLTPVTSIPRARTSRTPSPEKRAMLRSLRPPGKERASSSATVSQSPRKPNGFVASAASQAWMSTSAKVDGNSVSMPNSTTSRPAPTPLADKSRKSLDSATSLSYRSEYPASQTRNKIASQEAIDTARRKHGLGRPSRSPYRTPRPEYERDNPSDEYASPRPNETRRMKSNKGSSENENPRSPPTPPAPRISRRPLPGPSTTRGTTAGSNSKPGKPRRSDDLSSSSTDERSRRRRPEGPSLRIPIPVDTSSSPVRSSDDEEDDKADPAEKVRQSRIDALMKKVPRGVDEAAAKQIFNEIVVHGDEVHWDDIAGLDIAKDALKETVVYPFLRPDLFMGLREPARGMLLFGPPGTGKTMLARAVATESKSTFFAISASSLTSKFLGESEKLVRALFGIAKAMAPSIIFVDEIDSLLSARGDSGEHEATRRIKTEFLIQWSDLARAAAGREQSAQEKERGDASRVLVLAATNLPWAIDEAARRRFVRRQYIPLPEDEVRKRQLKTLLGAQKHGLNGKDIERLVALTDGFSGSDITYLAKDAAMGPLRSLGDKLLNMTMEDIRPIEMKDFVASLKTIRPSVSKQGIEKFEDWAREFGERGG